MTGRPRVTPASAQAGTGTDQITFIGTATTVIQVPGFTILTDPNFLHRGQRAYVGLGLTTRRLTEPALSIGQLPPLDFVVLTHHHGDHFDRIAAPDRRDPADYGRPAGGRGAARRRPAGGHPDPLRRLHAVQVAALRLPEGGRPSRPASVVHYLDRGDSYRLGPPEH